MRDQFNPVLFFSPEIQILLEYLSFDKQVKVIPQFRLCTKEGLRLSEEEFCFQFKKLFQRYVSKSSPLKKFIVILDIGNPHLFLGYDLDERYQSVDDRYEAYTYAVCPALLYWEVHHDGGVRAFYHEPARDITFSASVQTVIEGFFGIARNTAEDWFFVIQLRESQHLLSAIELLFCAEQRILGTNLPIPEDEILRREAGRFRKKLIDRFYRGQTFNQIYKASAKYFLALYVGGVVFSAAKYIEMLIVMKSGDQGLQSGVLLGSIMKVTGLIAAMPLRSISILGATAYGARNYDEVSALMQSGYIASGILSLVTMTILAFSKDWLEKLFNQDTGISSEVGQFFLRYLLCMPAITLSTVCGMIVSSVNKPYVVAIVNLPTALLGLGATYALVYGKFGFNKYGMNGLAISNNFQNWVNLFFYGVYFALTRNSRQYSLFCGISPAILFKRLKLIFKKGIPLVFETGSEYVYLFVTALYAGLLGKKALMQAGIIEQYSFLLSVTSGLAIRQTAIQYAAEIQGRNSMLLKLRSDLPVIRENLRTLPRLVSALSLGVALPFDAILLTSLTVFYKPLSSFYVDNEQLTHDFFSEMLWLFVLTGVNGSVDTYRNIMGGVLNGLGDIISPMIISIFLTLSCGAGLGKILGFVSDLGLEGVVLSTGIAYFLGLSALLKLVFSAHSLLNHPTEIHFDRATNGCPRYKYFFARQIGINSQQQEREMETIDSHYDPLSDTRLISG